VLFSQIGDIGSFDPVRRPGASLLYYTSMPSKGPPPKRTPKKETPEDRIPRVIGDPSLDDHLAVISRAIFQAGLSWAMIDGRWETFRQAFDDFRVAVVANYGEGDIQRIMETDGVVHARGKIRGTIANAQALQALEREHGSVAAYARAFPSYEALYADAKSRFAYLGDLSCYYWLFRTGLAVPPFVRWLERQDRDHPRMREMVELGRREGRSSEASV
jgi:hypothetical protein